MSCLNVQFNIFSLIFSRATANQLPELLSQKILVPFILQELMELSRCGMYPTGISIVVISFSCKIVRGDLTSTLCSRWYTSVPVSIFEKYRRNVILVWSILSLFSSYIVKFTQLCSKFPPTVLLNFACDWLALDRDISFGQLTSPSV